jgi:Flp pilus assembly protein CpaB
VDVPQARHVVRPAWINLRTVLGVLLFSVAFLAGQRLLTSAQDDVSVWTAATDLASGTSLGPGQLEMAEVRLSPDLMNRYVSAGSDVDGYVLNRPVAAGELIPSDALVEAGGVTGHSMTVPVTPEHANGGALHPGDRVVVYASLDVGEPTARTIPVAQEVEVLDVVTVGGLVADEQQIAAVTVAVSEEDAGRLTFAARNGELDIVLVTGGAKPADGAATVRAEDFP